jgi:hypothetical protein
MLEVKESPLLSGMYFIVDSDGEVHYGPFLSKSEATSKLKDIENDQD